MCKVQPRVQKIAVLQNPLFKNRFLTLCDVLLFAEVSQNVIESSISSVKITSLNEIPAVTTCSIVKNVK
jgi:hypothetical protein